MEILAYPSVETLSRSEALHKALTLPFCLLLGSPALLPPFFFLPASWQVLGIDSHSITPISCGGTPSPIPTLTLESFEEGTRSQDFPHKGRFLGVAGEGRDWSLRGNGSRRASLGTGQWDLSNSLKALLFLGGDMNYLRNSCDQP